MMDNDYWSEENTVARLRKAAEEIEAGTAKFGHDLNEDGDTYWGLMSESYEDALRREFMEYVQNGTNVPDNLAELVISLRAGLTPFNESHLTDPIVSNLMKEYLGGNESLSFLVDGKVVTKYVYDDY